VIFNERSTLTRAFRNIPGVDLVSVTRLNLLKLAPGGHLGRFIVWTQDAIERVESIYGSTTVKSKEKNNYHLPHAMMTNPDLARIINSTEIQVALKAKKAKAPRTQIKKNPLHNLRARNKLDPSTIQRRRLALLAAASAEARRKKVIAARKKFLAKRKAKGKPIGVSKDFVKKLHQL
jgi:large subunit ribosomal protein L4e